MARPSCSTPTRSSGTRRPSSSASEQREVIDPRTFVLFDTLTFVAVAAAVMMVRLLHDMLRWRGILQLHADGSRAHHPREHELREVQGGRGSSSSRRRRRTREPVRTFGAPSDVDDVSSRTVVSSTPHAFEIIKRFFDATREAVDRWNRFVIFVFHFLLFIKLEILFTDSDFFF